MQNLFGGLAGLGSVVANLQVEWRTRSGGKPQTVTLRGRNNETEVLPLFTNQDSIVGDVKPPPAPLLLIALSISPSTVSPCKPSLQDRGRNSCMRHELYKSAICMAIHMGMST